MKSCIICNSKTSFLLKKEEYDLYKCEECSLVFVDPQPSESFLKDKVYSLESGYQGNKRRDLQNAIPDYKTKRILKDMQKFFGPNLKGKRLLDVGCSNGEFMYHAEKLGFETAGVELNKRTADIAKENGLKVYNGFLNDAGFTPNSFDVVFLGDIIEHVSEPRQFVADCAKLLKTGGIIVISTPNLDCFWSRSTFVLYRLFKIPWSSVTPPHHLYQFSFGNLNLLMEQSGFKHIGEFFMRPPRLMYELGGLHVVRRFKKQKTSWNFICALFSLELYIDFYFIDFITTPFRRKNFSMVVTYQKTND